MLEAVEEELVDEFPGAWNEFHDPVSNFQAQRGYANSQRIVRSLDEIELPLEAFSTGTLDDIVALKLPASVQSMADKRQLIETLLHIDFTVAQVDTERARGAGVLSPQNVRDLDTFRHRLLRMLFTVAGRDHTDAFQNAQKQYVYHIDTLLFRSYLRFQGCIFSDARMQRNFHSTVPADFTGLLKKGAVPRTLLQKPIVEFTIPDLVWAVKYLEDKWLLLHFDAQFSDYLDLLSARLGAVIAVPQPPFVYGNISNYQEVLSESEVTYSERLLQDMCWSLVPMYKKLHYYAIMTQNVDHSVTVSNATRDAVERLVTDVAFELENKTLIEVYSKLYTKCALRPSERAKFRRDYRNTTETTPSIIEKVRGKSAKRTIMENLARAPWVIMREKLIERPLRDLLVLLLIDSYVSNNCNVAWFNTFVETNIELLHETQPRDYCNRHYPILVQYFNRFGLYYQGTLYPHASAAKCFVHWLHIMMRPPFSGKWVGKSLVELTYHVPRLDSEYTASVHPP